SKLIDIAGYIKGMRHYQLIPARTVPFAAAALIIIETFVALAHFLAIGLRVAIPGTIMMLTMFLLVTANSLFRGEKRPCMCFSASGEDQLNISSVGRIALLLLAELMLYWQLVAEDRLMALPKLNMLSVTIAAVSVLLIGWCLTISSFSTAWRVLRS